MRVHVAQPGVSAQVRRLERELGQELLDRTGRAVTVTDVGAAVLPYARAALRAVAGARHAVEELTGLVRGHVTVGMITSFSVHTLDLPGLLAGFHERHPAVEISLTEDNSDRLVEALHQGDLDMAFVGLSGPAPAGVETQAIVEEDYAAVVAHGDPLAARRTVTLAALSERRLISLPVGTGTRAAIDRAFAAANLRPHIAFEASDPYVLAQLAGRGLGVAIVPASVAHGHRDEFRGLDLVRPRLRGRIALAWRAEGPINPAARALVGHARATLPDWAQRPA